MKSAADGNFSATNVGFARHRCRRIAKRRGHGIGHTLQQEMLCELSTRDLVQGCSSVGFSARDVYGRRIAPPLKCKTPACGRECRVARLCAPTCWYAYFEAVHVIPMRPFVTSN